jgi:hypothetical protein
VTLEERKKHEQKIMGEMIAIYCKGNHGGEGKLCAQCRELLEYSKIKIDSCPMGEAKTFCSDCKVHCYGKDMRITVKKVMRYAGPRMLIRHPILAIKHMILTLKSKNKNHR